jgi:hypothetical protein
MQRAQPSLVRLSVIISCRSYFIKSSLVVFVNATPPKSFNTLNLAKYTPLDTGVPEFCAEFQVTV